MGVWPSGAYLLFTIYSQVPFIIYNYVVLLINIYQWLSFIIYNYVEDVGTYADKAVLS